MWLCDELVSCPGLTLPTPGPTEPENQNAVSLNHTFRFIFILCGRRSSLAVLCHQPWRPAVSTSKSSKRPWIQTPSFLYSVFAEAGPLRAEVTPALKDVERSQDVTPATIQSSREILSLLTDDLDLPKSSTPREPRVSPPGVPDPTAEPLCPPSPAEPADKKRKKVPTWKKCYRLGMRHNLISLRNNLTRKKKTKKTVINIFKILSCPTFCSLLVCVVEELLSFTSFQRFFNNPAIVKITPWWCH